MNIFDVAVGFAGGLLAAGAGITATKVWAWLEAKVKLIEATVEQTKAVTAATTATKTAPVAAPVAPAT